MVGAFKPFDQSIFCCGVDHESFTDSSDGLVVGRVDLQGPLLDDLFEVCPRMNHYWMTAFLSFCSLLVFQGVWKLGRDILVERPAQGDVDSLRAATDSQKR